MRANATTLIIFRKCMKLIPRIKYKTLKLHFPPKAIMNEANNINKLNPSQGPPIITPLLPAIPMWNSLANGVSMSW